MEEYKDTILFLEEVFFLMYYLGLNADAATKMPVLQRSMLIKWFAKRQA